MCPCAQFFQLLPLPEPFDKALNSKRESVKALKATIHGAGLDDRARGDLQRAVMAHFRVGAGGVVCGQGRERCVCVSLRGGL